MTEKRILWDVFSFASIFHLAFSKRAIMKAPGKEKMKIEKNGSTVEIWPDDPTNGKKLWLDADASKLVKNAAKVIIHEGFDSLGDDIFKHKGIKKIIVPVSLEQAGGYDRTWEEDHCAFGKNTKVFFPDGRPLLIDLSDDRYDFVVYHDRLKDKLYLEREIIKLEGRTDLDAVKTKEIYEKEIEHFKELEKAGNTYDMNKTLEELNLMENYANSTRKRRQPISKELAECLKTFGKEITKGTMRESNGEKALLDFHDYVFYSGASTEMKMEKIKPIAEKAGMTEEEAVSCFSRYLNALIGAAMTGVRCEGDEEKEKETVNAFNNSPENIAYNKLVEIIRSSDGGKEKEEILKDLAIDHQRHRFFSNDCDDEAKMLNDAKKEIAEGGDPEKIVSGVFDMVDKYSEKEVAKVKGWKKELETAIKETEAEIEEVFGYDAEKTAKFIDEKEKEAAQDAEGTEKQKEPSGANEEKTESEEGGNDKPE